VARFKGIVTSGTERVRYRKRVRCKFTGRKITVTSRR
jgi:hypothetical protein